MYPVLFLKKRRLSSGCDLLAERKERSQRQCIMVTGILNDAPTGLAGVLPRSGVGDFGILVDGADHGCHPGLGASGDPSEQVGHEVGAAPLAADPRRRLRRWRRGVPDERPRPPAPPHRDPWRTASVGRPDLCPRGSPRRFRRHTPARSRVLGVGQAHARPAVRSEHLGWCIVTVFGLLAVVVVWWLRAKRAGTARRRFV